ncbi:MAG TPA: sugar kinase [Bacteroidetes bacterium]|nr:putative sugar kinase YdjH [bacterium BMS3Bbin04]HDO64461.1 sugar kinase [Bacteroidota bacterium]HEX03586.1 sugar kinase [Bacteroidota bacterium]
MATQTKPVLVVGSAALDTIHTPVGSVDDALGGSCFYFSTAASLFTPVRMVAVIGADFPRKLIDFLNDRDVDLSGLMVEPGETFRWGGKYFDDPNKRETLFTKLGVFENFQPKIPGHFRDTPIVFLGNIHPDLQISVLDQISKPELVILDTMNFWISGTPDRLKEVISRVDALLVNDEEATELTGKINLFEAADALLDMDLQAVVVKKGQHGAILFREGMPPFFAPAYPVRNVKDPTGAGDTFAGGFIGYLANHDLADDNVWRQAIIYGTAVASASVEDFSLDRLKNVNMDELEVRVDELRSMTRF